MGLPSPVPSSVPVPAPGVSPAAACPNCGAAVFAKFCPECGQRQDRARPTLRHLLDEAADELFSVDAKLIETLRLLLRPGRLTLAYLAGRRERYVRPFRLYLTANVLLFLLLALMPTHGGFWANAQHGFDAGVQSASRTGAGSDADAFLKQLHARHPWLATHLERFLASGRGNPVAPFRDAYLAAGPKIDILALPWFALLLLCLFSGEERLYAEHFVFALHYHAFSLLIAVVEVASTLLGSPLLASVLSIAIGAIPLVYLLLALRRVYNTGTGATLWRMAVLLVGTAVVKSALTVAAVLWVIARA